MLITTTPILTNAKILQYCGIVITNVVIGTNILSDDIAALMDFFGGHSGTYRQHLDSIYEEIINGLEAKAMQKNANAIIGLHIDFNEISGKGKQMFMGTATGTACRVELLSSKPSGQNKKGISDTTVEQLIISRSLRKKLKEASWSPNAKDWEYILSHNMPELSTLLAEFYFTLQDFDKRQAYRQCFQLYLSSLAYDDAVNALYPLLEDHTEGILPLIEKQRLFNPQNVLSFIEKGNLSLVIKLLAISKEYYSPKDLQLMEEILNKLDNLPDRGQMEKIACGPFNKKEKEVYICPNGHKNSKEVAFCEKSKCGLNIKGLVSDDLKIIEDFREKVKALKDIMQAKEKDA